MGYLPGGAPLIDRLCHGSGWLANEAYNATVPLKLRHSTRWTRLADAVRESLEQWGDYMRRAL